MPSDSNNSPHASQQVSRPCVGDGRAGRRFAGTGIEALALALSVVTAVQIGAISFAYGQRRAADCPAISANTRDKIVISQVKGLAADDLTLQQHRVRNAINMQFPSLKSELRDFVNPIVCDGRQPTEDSFDRERSSLLNDFGVIVEVWGEVHKDGSLLHYAVIPIRIYEHFAKRDAGLTGYYVAEYGARVGEDKPTELQSLFRDNHEVRSFATLALAAKFLQRTAGAANITQKSQFYDNARALFCQAVGLLAEARQHGLRGLREPEWAALSSYAEQSARTVAQKAIADSGYSGFMKLLPKEELERCS